VARSLNALKQTYSGSHVADNRVVAFCWQSGETDAQNSQTAAYYKTNMTTLLQQWQANMIANLQSSAGLTSTQALACLSTLTMLEGGMTPAFIENPGQTNTGANGTATTAILPAQRDISGTTITNGTSSTPIWTQFSVPFPCYYVNSQGMGLDANGATPLGPADPDIHFDQYGYEMLATAYFDRWMRAWGVMPPQRMRSAFSTYGSDAAYSDPSLGANTLALGNTTNGGVAPVMDPTRNGKIVVKFNTPSSTNSPYVAITTSGNVLPAGDVSISAWVNWAKIGLNTNNMHAIGGSPGGTGFASGSFFTIWSFQGSAKIQTSITSTSSLAQLVQEPTATVAGQWAHFLSTYSNANGVLTLYVNGVSVGQFLVAAANPSLVHFSIS